MLLDNLRTFVSQPKNFCTQENFRQTQIQNDFLRCTAADLFEGRSQVTRKPCIQAKIIDPNQNSHRIRMLDPKQCMQQVILSLVQYLLSRKEIQMPH